MATIEEVLAANKAKKAFVSEKNKLQGREMGIAPEALQQLEDRRSMQSAVEKKIEQGFQAIPLQALDAGRTGKLDRWGEMFPGIEKVPVVGDAAEYMDSLHRKLWGERGPFEKGAQAILDKFPSLKKMVDERVQGKEFSKDPIGWRELTPDEERVFDEWSSVNPITGGFDEFIPNMGKAIAGQGANLVFAAATPVGGGIALYDTIRFGVAEQAEARAKDQGIAWDPAANDEALHMTALVESGLESVGNGVSLLSIFGRKAMVKNLSGPVARGVANTLGVITPGASEGLTEFVQTLSTDTAIDKMLAKAAEEQGLPYIPLTREEKLANAKEAGQIGSSIGFVLGSAGTRFDRKPAEVAAEDKVPSRAPMVLGPEAFAAETAKPAKDWTADESQDIVLTFHQKAIEYGEEGLAVADDKIRGLLMAEEIPALLSMARAFNLHVTDSNRENLVNMLIENRMQLPEYRKLALASTLDSISRDNLDSENQNYFKWMAQGDIKPEELVQFRVLMEEAVKNSTFDGTYKELFDQYVAFAGDNQGYVEYNQLGKPDWSLIDMTGYTAEFENSFAVIHEKMGIEMDLNPLWVERASYPVEEFPDESEADQIKRSIEELKNLTTPLSEDEIVKLATATVKEFRDRSPMSDEFETTGAPDKPRASFEGTSQKVSSLNKEAVLELLGSKQYAGDTAEITAKEVFQNSIDNIKKNMATGENPDREHQYTFGYGRDEFGNSYMVMTDTGLGMDPYLIMNTFLPAATTGKTIGEGGGFGLAKLAFLGDSQKFILHTITKFDGRFIGTRLEGTGLAWRNFTAEDPDIDYEADKTLVIVPGLEMTYTYLRDRDEITGAEPQTGTTFASWITFADNGRSWTDRAAEFIDDINIRIQEVPDGEHPKTLRQGGNLKSMFSDAAMGYYDSEGYIVSANSDTGPLQLIEKIESPYADIEVIISTDKDVEYDPNDIRMQEGSAFSIPILNRGIYQFMHLADFQDKVKLPRDIAINIKPKVKAGDSKYPFDLSRDGFHGPVGKTVNQWLNKKGDSAREDQIKLYKEIVNSADSMPSGRKFIDGTRNIPAEIQEKYRNDPIVAEIDRVYDEMFSLIMQAFKAKYPQIKAYQRAKYNGFMVGTSAYGVHFGTKGSSDPSQIYMDPQLIMRDAIMEIDEAHQVLSPIQLKTGDDFKYDTYWSDVVTRFFEMSTGVAAHEAFHQLIDSEGINLAREFTFKIGALSSSLTKVVQGTKLTEEQAQRVAEAILDYGKQFRKYADPQFASKFIAAQSNAGFGYSAYTTADLGGPGNQAPVPSGGRGRRAADGRLLGGQTQLDGLITIPKDVQGGMVTVNDPGQDLHGQTVQLGKLMMRMGPEELMVQIFPDEGPMIWVSTKYLKGSPLVLELHQTGYKDEGGTTPRGRLRIMREGKFMIDLFKTGDILTLAHEFMHMISVHTDQDMKNALIDAMVKEQGDKLEARGEKFVREKMARVWNEFQLRPFEIAKNLGPHELPTLERMQEFLAENFEMYLMGIAPSTKMEPVFKAMRTAMLKYYASVRQQPLKWQNVDHALAQQFDKLLAGKKPLPLDVRTRKVLLPDEDGKVKTYNILLSRPQSETIKVLLKHLRSAFKELDTTKELLEDYTEAWLGTWEDRMNDDLVFVPTLVKSGLTTDHKNAIRAVENRKQALMYMKRVEKEHVKAIEAKRKKEFKNLQKKLAKLKKIAREEMPPDVQEALQALLDTFDQDELTYDRIKRGLKLEKALNKMANVLNEELSAIPAELRSVTGDDLKNLKAMQNQSIYSMSAKELRYLWSQLDDIQRYNKHRMKQAAEETYNEQEALNKKLRMENNGNWRLKVKRMTLHPVVAANLGVQMVQAKNVETKRQLLVLRTLANDNPDSIWNKLADDLEIGRTVELAEAAEHHEFLRALRETLPSQGISSVLGYVRQKDRIPIKMHRVGQNPDVLIDEALANAKYTLQRRYLDQLSAEYKELPYAEQVEIAIANDPKALELHEKIREWENEGSVTVTIAQLMLWYGYSQNTIAREALLENGVKFRTNMTETFQFRSEEEFYTIIDQLDDKYKRVVDEVISYYGTRILPPLQDKYMSLNHGIGLVVQENYLPLHKQIANIGNAEFISRHSLNMTNDDYYRQHIQSMEFLNVRLGGSDPVYAGDFFGVVATNMDNVAFYMGMAEPLIQARMQIFGQEYVPGSVHSQMVKMVGMPTVKGTKKWLDNLESPGPRIDSDLYQKIIKANATARKGILNMSASISAIQSVSAIMGANYGLSTMDFAKGFKDRRISIPELMAYDPRLRERYERMPVVALEEEGFTGKSRRAWTSNTTLWADFLKLMAQYESGQINVQDVLNFIVRSENSSMFSLMFFDSLALSLIINATNNMAARTGMSPDAAKKHTMMIITRTQPMNDPLYTSNFLGTKEMGLKLTWGVFHSARDAIRGEMQWWTEYIYDAYNNPKYNKKEKAKRVKKGMTALFTAVVATSQIVALIQEAFSRIGPGPEDDDDEHWLDNFFLSWQLRSVTNMLSIDPLGGTLAAGWINYHARGWEIGIAELPLATIWAYIGTDFSKLLKAMTDDKEGNAGPAAVKLVSSITKSLGMAWANLERQWSDWFGDDPNDFKH